MSLMAPILLVEDNPMDVDLTRRAFERRKLTNPLLVARDGQEALDLFAAWPEDRAPPAVMLLDLKLPKVDGISVLRALRSHPRLGHTPVVVLTTSAEDADVTAAYACGANSYIIKPVDFEKFLEVAGQLEVYWMLLNTAPRPGS
jgi:CheY-like chemotaxis protein